MANAFRVARGEKIIRPFGEALAEYLEVVSPGKLSHADNLSNAAALRWPFHYRNQFYLLEELPMDDSEYGIVVGLERYINDLKKVEKRSRLNKELYHLRREGKELVWYHQPNPRSTARPMPRQRVTNERLLKRLDDTKGRGPFSQDTLRLRQGLVSTVLGCAHTKWRWTDKNLKELIDKIEAGEGRTAYLNREQFMKLREVCQEEGGEMLTFLLLGAAWIGWRRSNLIGLTWERVVWSQTEMTEDGPIKSPGFLFIRRTKGQRFDPFDRSQRKNRTKNGKELITVMSDRVENLLRQLEQRRHPESELVFHKGDGKEWGDFRKRWSRLKKLAGIDPGFRWHDLRHTWASEQLNSGVEKHLIMEQQGWKDIRMVDRYGHLELESRFAGINKVK
ncbi:site-specific integrase [Endozoicomonas gorgoniicola]|uniref:Site-specific integrase n=1 Tax=Endozoicomonas gorgoniicola TaxID=1234144 RepID=A0ABT3N1P1_9GAMM|nr:site-specific integrase [Endozoicomonas gorgoniicola]MCW7555548.1 site-specific integrase [Endozoicomonas gorgoniicola]